MNLVILAGSSLPASQLRFTPIMQSRAVQGSQTQRNVRSSMSDPDMFLNYTPSHNAGPARYPFPEGVHVPEGSAEILSYINICCKSPSFHTLKYSVIAWHDFFK